MELAVHPGAIELILGQQKLVVLSALAVPSLAMLLAELVTFLLPFSADVARQLARERENSKTIRLDPLVEISHFDPTIAIDSRYATIDNGARRALYPPQMRHRCFVRRSVAEQLRRAQISLHQEGYGLKLWDGYRPYTIQWQCADPRVIPDAAIRRLFAPPNRGSNHARGCAVDITLVELKTGKECVMPTGFDCASPAAASNARAGLSREAFRNRRRLQTALMQADFFTIPAEWWHFNYRPDRTQERSRNAGDLYLVLDIPFDTLLAAQEP